MDKRIVIFFITFLSSVILFAQKQNSGAILNPEDLAWELNSYKDYRFRNKPTQPYINGNLKIVSGGKNGVVVGIDENSSGIWDKFIGLQTSEKYDLNEDIAEGEIIYTPALVIVNAKNDERRFILKLENDKSNTVESKIPEKELRKVQKHLVGYGLHVHKGRNYKFEDFIVY